MLTELSRFELSDALPGLLAFVPVPFPEPFDLGLRRGVFRISSNSSSISKVAAWGLKTIGLGGMDLDLWGAHSVSMKSMSSSFTFWSRLIPIEAARESIWLKPCLE